MPEPVVPPKTPEPKPGWKTTEFATTVLGGLVLPQAIPDVPPLWRAILSVASVIAYALSRGLAKGPRR